MKWFEGSISEAVAASKSQNAVFVVYIEGNDERSAMMTTALDFEPVSEKLESKKFVCIKLAKDSEGHSQFTQIYKMVPVPSLFLIGDNGMPLEVIPGENNREILIKRLVSAVSKASGEPLLDPAPSVSSAGQSSNTEISHDTDRSAANLVQEVAAALPTESPAQAPSPEFVQELLKKSREEAKKKDEEKEKDAEIRRRQQGQELAIARRKQQERELEELKREREREKREEAAARERVLRHINEDKEARLARQQAAVSPAPPPASEETSQPPRPASPPSNSTRIQFKLPDCQTHTQTFTPSDTIQDLRNFIDANIKLPFREYTLATTFPRREFTARDLGRDLQSLELVPSGVILIMPLSHGVVSTRMSWGAAVWGLLWDMVQPLFSVGRYLRSFISGSPESEPGPSSSAPSQPSTSAAPRQQYPPPNAGSGRTVRKRGNIHTLHDGNDSNDENNTWNGNSTQLM